MALAVSTVVGDALRAYKDLTQADALTYLNYVLKKAAYDYRIFITQENIALTAGTPVYTLNDRTIKVWSAQYALSATPQNSYRLVPTSDREMDADSPGWRYFTGSGDPNEYYVIPSSTGAPQLGLWPTPITSSTPTYPRVELQISQEPTSVIISDSMPAIIRDPAAWTLGIIARHCFLNHPEKFPYWDDRFRMEMVETEKRTMSLVADYKPKMVPWAISYGGRY